MATRTRKPAPVTAPAPTITPRELALPVPASDINAALTPAIPAPAPVLPSNGTAGQHGMYRARDVGDSPRKVAAYAAMFAAGAHNGTFATCAAVQLAGGGMVSSRDIWHYAVHGAASHTHGGLPRDAARTAVRKDGARGMVSLTPAGVAYLHANAALLAALPGCPVALVAAATPPAPPVVAPPASEPTPAPQAPTKGKRKASK